MQKPERVPSGGNVKSAERDRQNFAVRVAVRKQGKIVTTHLLTGTPGALGFASAKDANLLAVFTPEGESADTGSKGPRRSDIQVEVGTKVEGTRGQSSGFSSLRRSFRCSYRCQP
jgi:hypothetical protein